MAEQTSEQFANGKIFAADRTGSDLKGDAWGLGRRAALADGAAGRQEQTRSGQRHGQDSGQPCAGLFHGGTFPLFCGHNWTLLRIIPGKND
jgi:hypothetical protein